MKKLLIFLLKLGISSILAVTILSLWCLVYYNPPISIAQPDGYTNNRYQPHSRWADMTEGYGWGSINDIGYNNAADYDPSLKTIAFIGSSQVQAVQVPQDKNMVSLTQKMLHGDDDPNNDYQCLNLGVSGHFFNISVSNYEYFVEHFDNVDYVVMELGGFDYTAEDLDKMLAGEFHVSSGNRGILYTTLQKIPYLRLLVKQWQDVNKASADEEPEESIAGEDLYPKVEAVIQKLANLSNEHGIKLILVYHQQFTVNPDHSVDFHQDAVLENHLIKSCEVNNVPIIVMNQTMVDHYEAYHEFSYGFSNSTPGAGHLNTVGHKLIAQRVYDEIVELMRKE